MRCEFWICGLWAGVAGLGWSSLEVAFVLTPLRLGTSQLHSLYNCVPEVVAEWIGETVKSPPTKLGTNVDSFRLTPVGQLQLI